METLKRIDFVCALVDAKLLSPDHGIWALNGGENFLVRLRNLGLVVEEHS